MPDDDDYNNSYMIEAGVNALESNPDASLAFGSVEYIDGNNSCFIKDSPPYRLDGPLMERIITYITYDITDHLLYGLCRTTVIKNYNYIIILS